MERIIGPMRGFYIASYACPMGELGNIFLGHSRVFDSTKPRSFWDAKPIAEAIEPVTCASLEEAHHRALLTGLQQARCLADA
ncbi:MAG TPA: hypothetical protein VHA82_14065 [Ramlibacter sp.]|uniref:hypothetical protein n=1 Tax=Ramlibacter sp. TaxID=1917967 RepID=UPI002C7E6B64|nr:hypothetical protein [Ramlibacter sp.]HVZ44932.1 hypothetical protein [Ramlibacter sp.]